jgi:hypothetical protein
VVGLAQNWCVGVMRLGWGWQVVACRVDGGRHCGDRPGFAGYVEVWSIVLNCSGPKWPGKSGWWGKRRSDQAWPVGLERLDLAGAVLARRIGAYGHGLMREVLAREVGSPTHAGALGRGVAR